MGIFPTCILIDHGDIVRFRDIESRWERTGSLEDAIRDEVKLVAKTAAQ